MGTMESSSVRTRNPGGQSLVSQTQVAIQIAIEDWVDGGITVDNGGNN